MNVCVYRFTRPHNFYTPDASASVPSAHIYICVGVSVKLRFIGNERRREEIGVLLEKIKIQTILRRRRCENNTDSLNRKKNTLGIDPIDGSAGNFIRRARLFTDRSKTTKGRRRFIHFAFGRINVAFFPQTDSRPYRPSDCGGIAREFIGRNSDTRTSPIPRRDSKTAE